MPDAAAPRRPTREEVRQWLRAHKPHHRPGPLWKALQLLIAGSKDQAFLDRRVVSALLALTPGRWRQPLAVRLLALSPHYWIYQWSDHYAPDLRRSEILAREVARVDASRQAVCDRLLSPYLEWPMTVLDVGTGPGFLARALAHRVAKVIACDVSRGVVACARALNFRANLTYLVNPPDGLGPVPDGSIDVAVAIALLQHLTEEHTQALLREIGRVLKPGGLGLCQLRLEDPDDQRQWHEPPTGWRARRVMPRMVHFRAPEVVAMLQGLGFVDVSVRAVREIAAIEDDIHDDHLACFRRPGGDAEPPR